MRIIFISITLFFLLISCKKEVIMSDTKEELIMYQPSEMTELMRNIYEFNKASKNRIENKKDLLGYPEEFERIHSAKLSNPAERDIEFDSLALIFLENQEAVFVFKTDSLENSFNKSINACIECHRTRCPGPLPKIKKLLIPKS